MVSCRVVVAVCIGLAAITLTSTVADETNCPLISTNKSEFREPIFLTNSTGKLTFYLPKSNGLVFMENEHFTILCPNPKNFLVNSNANVSTGVCTHGKLKVANKLYDSTELQCNKSVRGHVRKTNKRCGNNQGYLTNIGYYIGRKEEFLTLIEICYDGDKGYTLYSEHIIHGDSIRIASRAKFRPSFSTHGINTAASVAYKQTFQRATFSKLLGSSVIVDTYLNNTSYLSRGHLSPDADFLYAPWQYSTYFYLNACPQWQTVNGGNWHKVESMVRKTAGNLGENLLVVTGTHDILTLPNVNGTQTLMFLLPNQKLPIPKFNWKLLYRENGNEAIVIIVLNNPFLKNVNQSDYLCNDVCVKTGWSHDNWRKPDKGIVYCCEYNEFVKIVRATPTLNVKRILRGPNGH